MATPEIGKGGNPKVNLFKAETWQPGGLEKALDNAKTSKEDPLLSGRWESCYNAKDLEAYHKTLTGKPVNSYDPKGFLKEIGLNDVRSGGRGNAEMTTEYQLNNYKAPYAYVSGPTWLKDFLQKRLIGQTKKGTSAPDLAEKASNASKLKAPDLYGNEASIQKGDRSEISLDDRYVGLRSGDQYAWGGGVHSGSGRAGATEKGTFGTYDIAKNLGFTDDQAQRIAQADNGVDLDTTPYVENGKTIKTNAYSKPYLHFNLSPDGQEDTRITAAKVHLDRAIRFAQDGYCDVAEKELGVGLHSLQDIFAHGQTTLANHNILGNLPDMVSSNPVGMYEAAIATEGYLKKFAEGIKLKPMADPSSSTTIDKPLSGMANPLGAANDQKWESIKNLVGGNVSVEEQTQLATKLAEYPQELLDLLAQQKVQFFLGKEGTQLTDLGFGHDLDGDGKVTADKWVDLNKNGKQDAGEVEGQLDDGRKWNDLSAGYNGGNRTIFLSDKLLSGLDQPLQHEITHALDGILSQDDKLKEKWNAYREQLYSIERRDGEVSFAQSNSHETLADVSE